MNYLAYDPVSGEIRTWGSSSTDDSEPPQVDNRLVLVMDPDPAIGAWTHFYRAGAPVAYSSAQRAAKMAFPDVPSDWSNETFSWVPRSTVGP